VSHPNGVPSADLPNLRLTPGVALNVTVARICVPGYSSSVRAVSDAEKTQVYARYGVRWVPYQHEVDHLISLELGGSNVIANLWPEPYAGRWGARTKDVLENRLHDLVCSRQLSLRSAQQQEATAATSARHPVRAEAAAPAPAATTPRATRARPRSTAPTTRAGTNSRAPTSSTSGRTPRQGLGSRATTCTNPAD
jgi:hypothetical protein